MVGGTRNFSEVDFESVKKILPSLRAGSDLEKFKILVGWIQYSAHERNEHADDLLLNIRPPPLSVGVKPYIVSVKMAHLGGTRVCPAVFRIVDMISQEIRNAENY